MQVVTDGGTYPLCWKLALVAQTSSTKTRIRASPSCSTSVIAQSWMTNLTSSIVSTRKQLMRQHGYFGTCSAGC
jgi:hypothetical protein